MHNGLPRRPLRRAITALAAALPIAITASLAAAQGGPDDAGAPSRVAVLANVTKGNLAVAIHNLQITRDFTMFDQKIDEDEARALNEARDELHNFYQRVKDAARANPAAPTPGQVKIEICRSVAVSGACVP